MIRRKYVYKTKMAYSRDLPKMAGPQCGNYGLSWTITDYHGLSWTREAFYG